MSYMCIAVTVFAVHACGASRMQENFQETFQNSQRFSDFFTFCSEMVKSVQRGLLFLKPLSIRLRLYKANVTRRNPSPFPDRSQCIVFLLTSDMFSICYQCRNATTTKKKMKSVFSACKNGTLLKFSLSTDKVLHNL